jgi:hypothetical protein
MTPFPVEQIDRLVASALHANSKSRQGIFTKYVVNSSIIYMLLKIYLFLIMYIIYITY